MSGLPSCQPAQRLHSPVRLLRLVLADGRPATGGWNHRTHFWTSNHGPYYHWRGCCYHWRDCCYNWTCDARNHNDRWRHCYRWSYSSCSFFKIILALLKIQRTKNESWISEWTFHLLFCFKSTWKRIWNWNQFKLSGL